MSVCHICNGEGKEGGCPRCGLTPRKKLESNILPMSIPADIIPVEYQGDLWSREEDDKASNQIKKFDENLEKVLNEFLNGRIPKFSMFIAAPPKTGKTKFAYSCMQSALSQKFTVAPLFSTSDWRRLYRVSQMNPFYKLFGRYKWDEVIVLDVVFLYVDHGEEHYNDITLLKSILDTRASFGLSTFVISDYKLTDLVPKWNSDLYTAIYSTRQKRDFRRYPIVLHRFD